MDAGLMDWVNARAEEYPELREEIASICRFYEPRLWVSEITAEIEFLLDERRK